MALLWSMVLLLAIPSPRANAAAAVVPNEPVELEYMNRHIYTMRVSIGGVAPAERGRRALQRLRDLDPSQRGQHIELVDADWLGQPAVALRIGSSALLTVFSQDLDPEAGLGLHETALITQQRLQSALRARALMSQTDLLARGAASSATAILVCLVLIYGTFYLRRRVTRPLEERITHEATQHRILGIDWSDYALGVVRWVLQLTTVALAALWVTFALGHVLRQFPVTEPLAVQMRGHIVRGAMHLAEACWRALPSIGSIVLIVLVARGTTWALARFFDNVASGRYRISGLHAETARATQRMSVFVTWGVAMAAIYPHIPGSESYVFRGISVFIGFLFTLGSSSVVSQWMHGLVIVYSRSLRVGDDVCIGSTEGRVTELGPLSVKVIDAQGDEVTLPNTTVTSGTIVNFTRQACAGCSHATLALGLGYDVPHALARSLLTKAAQRTPGVVQNGARIHQKALADYAVQYRLIVNLHHQAVRADVFSDLVASVRDCFDEAGIAILSPLLISQVSSDLPAQAPAP